MYLVSALLSFFYMFLMILPRNRINYYCRCVRVLGRGARVRGRNCEKREMVEEGGWGGHLTVEISVQRYRSNYYQQPSAERSRSDQNI